MIIIKKTATKLLLGFVAALSMVLFACSKDEPTPSTEPQENPEQWGEESPHGFYFDVNSIELAINDEGFLRFKGKRPGSYIDSVVIRPGFIRGSRAKQESMSEVIAKSSFTVNGKRATPWNNIDQYVKMFSSIGIRPESRFSSDFPELSNLHVGDVKYFGLFVWNKLHKVDIISHKYFNVDIPAGGSMRGLESLEDLPEINRGGAMVTTVDGNSVFDRISKGVDIHGRSYIMNLPLGEDNDYGFISSQCNILINAFPDKAGDYPMTIIMEFESGIVLTRNFKIRYVNE